MELSEIRNKIDSLDQQIQDLFEARMLLCQDVARYKKAHNMPVFQAGREQQILDRVEHNAKDGLGLASRTMFANMMSISSQLQQKMLVASETAPEIRKPRMQAAVKIGCQGTVGANSETAAQAFSLGAAFASTLLLSRFLKPWNPANWNMAFCLFTTAPPAQSHKPLTS